MPILKRQLASLVRQKLKSYPAVAILGPRQSGKTTLAKTFSDIYYDLEQEEDRLKLDLNWDVVIRSKRLVVLDEAQAMPSLFPRLRGAIDSDPNKCGRFLILGSVAPALLKNVSESLTGRLAICELSPIILPELKPSFDESELWLRGGFPAGGIIHKKKFPAWQMDYLTLLAQRDLPLWGLPAKPQVTLRFFKMLAASEGQLWNASSIGASLGLSYHTVNQYLDYLENAYLISVLRPFHVNLGKRFIKSPKIYWRDSGLLHSLLGVTDRNSLLSQPWVGASWEGWAIHQILCVLRTKGLIFDAYFFRTAQGHEIDLLIEFAKGRWAFEFKLTSSPSIEDKKRLNTSADFIKADKRILVSRTTHDASSADFISCDIRRCLEELL